MGGAGSAANPFLIKYQLMESNISFVDCVVHSFFFSDNVGTFSLSRRIRARPSESHDLILRRPTVPDGWRWAPGWLVITDNDNTGFYFLEFNVSFLKYVSWCEYV